MPKISIEKEQPTPFDTLLRELKSHHDIMSAIFDRVSNETDSEISKVDLVFVATFLVVYESQTKANLKTVEGMVSAYKAMITSMQPRKGD